MDDIDRQLLSILLKAIPLTKRPFDWIGSKIGTDGAEVLLRIQRLKEIGALRRLAAVFDSSRIGYKNTLIAMSLGLEQLPKAAQMAGEHPGILHSVARDHFLNLWLTLALPGEASTEAHVEALHRQVRPQQTLILPIVSIYKAGRTLQEKGTSHGTSFWLECEKKVICRLQEDFPLTDEPYAAMAREMNVGEEEWMQTIQSLSGRGVLRRLGAIRPRVRNAPSEALVLWQISPERVDEIGELLSTMVGIKQCVCRQNYAHFPYNLYAVIEPLKDRTLEEFVEGLESQIGRWPILILRTLCEFRKTEPKYFSQDLETWGRKYLDQPALERQTV